MRVAVLHHWFVTAGGGERVAECIASLFPSADIFTLMASPEGMPASLRNRTLHTSFLQRWTFARTHHRQMMPLFPLATESLDLRGYDLILSSDSGPIKGVRIDRGATHICYCHSPMRYVWDEYETYRQQMTGLTRLAFTLAAGPIRRWDRRVAQRVTHFLANSSYVADRIRRSYGRESEVLHPPIDLQRAAETPRERPDEAYLAAGRLVGYKRTDLLIEACARLGRRLRIAGTGPDEPRLRELAERLDAPVEFLGRLSNRRLWREFGRARALLFAANEDFGMIPLEAQACGRPVIAYGIGGSLETVRAEGKDPTGIFFKEQTPEAAAEAILHWEAKGERHFLPESARQWASTFDTPIFLERYRNFVIGKVPAAAALSITPDEAMAAMAHTAE